MILYSIKWTKDTLGNIADWNGIFWADKNVPVYDVRPSEDINSIYHKLSILKLKYPKADFEVYDES